MEITLLQNVLKANDQIAAQNRELWTSHGIFSLNVMASPGAGKTSLILEMIRRLRGRARIGVVEGDVCSQIDAEKVSAAGAPVIQINTGGGCHLEAGQLASASNRLPLADLDLLLIENVGNLVCPAGFDLGESGRIVVSSVAEGDDKPQKYPAVFSHANAVVVSKTDLLPHVDFKLEAFARGVRGLNANVPLFPLSVVTGEGVPEWMAWVLGKIGK